MSIFTDSTSVIGSISLSEATGTRIVDDCKWESTRLDRVDLFSGLKHKKAALIR